MTVDVTVETTIDRPVRIVADYAGDPSNAPTWYRRIASADWQTEPPVRVGSQVTYTWSPVGADATRLTLRNHGEPAGFSRLTAPLVSFAMRRAMTQDLARLAEILESR
jgi:hypothetical protein